MLEPVRGYCLAAIKLRSGLLACRLRLFNLALCRLVKLKGSSLRCFALGLPAAGQPLKPMKVRSSVGINVLASVLTTMLLHQPGR